MNYILNSKNRKFKYKLHLLFNRLSFNFLNLTLSQEIAMAGILIAFVGLFMNWSTIEYEKVIKSNAFSLNSGYVGYIILLVLAFTTFIILSNKNKEKLKTKAHIIFHDYTIIIFAGILIFLLSVAVFNSIRGFTTFIKSITVEKGVIFEMISSFFILVGGILAYREKKQEILSKVYIENSKFETSSDMEDYKDILGAKENQNKSNMSLPI